LIKKNATGNAARLVLLIVYVLFTPPRGSFKRPIPQPRTNFN